MGQKTKIEWTDVSWNPVHGCSKVSTGCKNCYAETLSLRRGHTTAPWTARNAEQNVMLKPHKLREPLSNAGPWKNPCRVFVNSMSDLFHEEIPDAYIAQVFAVMAEASQHTFQVLTKRPERMRDLLSSEDFQHAVAKAVDAQAVAEEVRAMGPERTRSIPGFPGYLVTDRGRILREGCSETCLWCSEPLPETMIARAKFCGQKCNSKAHYEKNVGRWKPPAHVTRAMSPEVGEQGHMRVQLIAPDGTPHRVGVHRLVLSSFVREPYDGEQGCHRDGDATNNALPNLRWGSQSDNWRDRIRHGNHRTHRRADRPEAWIKPDLGFEWPLPNCWAGVSIESRKWVGRADVLRETPAAVRFISAEPLLGLLVARKRIVEAPDRPNGWQAEYVWGEGTPDETIGFRPGLDLTDIDWLIVGGESGPGHRPMDLKWARDLRDACAETDTALFVKQLGGSRPGTALEDLPEDLRIRQYPVALERMV